MGIGNYIVIIYFSLELFIVFRFEKNIFEIGQRKYEKLDREQMGIHMKDFC
jgi:hypothetical protein